MTPIKLEPKPTKKGRYLADWQEKDAKLLAQVEAEWPYSAKNPVPGRTYADGSSVTYPEGYPVTHYRPKEG